jgi:type II secretory pathway component PulF
MHRDELAFFNDQLAAMLRQGIPLEGAIRQLCEGMRQGRLRDELQLLEKDLAQGRPLREAAADRSLPDLYRRLLVIGAEGGDLPGLLTLVADHYHQASNLELRLRGLLVYPAMALITSMLVSILLAMILGSATRESGMVHSLLNDSGVRPDAWSPAWHMGLWMGPFILGGVLFLGTLRLTVPQWRQALRWRMPGFADAALSNLASTLALLVTGGTRLPDALRLCADLESAPAASRSLREWEASIARGEPVVPSAGKRQGVFPPLFHWLIRSDSEDWLKGLKRAAEIYRRRAQAKAEIVLYAALPVLVLVLGFIVLGQAAFVVQMIYGTLIRQLDMLGG